MDNLHSDILKKKNMDNLTFIVNTKKSLYCFNFSQVFYPYFKLCIALCWGLKAK